MRETCVFASFWVQQLKNRFGVSAGSARIFAPHGGGETPGGRLEAGHRTLVTMRWRPAREADNILRPGVSDVNR